MNISELRDVDYERELKLKNELVGLIRRKINLNTMKYLGYIPEANKIEEIKTKLISDNVIDQNYNLNRNKEDQLLSFIILNSLFNVISTCNDQIKKIIYIQITCIIEYDLVYNYGSKEFVKNFDPISDVTTILKTMNQLFELSKNEAIEKSREIGFKIYAFAEIYDVVD